MRYFFILFIIFLMVYLSTSIAEAYQIGLTPTLISTSSLLTQTEIVSESAPSISVPIIHFPLPGQALQGNVPIIGRTDLSGFVSSELLFSYNNNPTNTWFLIDQQDQAVMDALLAQWETSTITDGAYNLRLVVYLVDGSSPEVIIEGIRIRNYTPIETNTPFSIIPVATPIIATMAPSRVPVQPTGTPVPPNPLVLDTDDVFSGALKGGLAVLGLFALGILYWLIRSKSRRGPNG